MIPTTERLAQALEAEGLPPAMIERARNGWYDDFKSPNATPCMLLVQDLRDHGRDDLAKRAADGEWDATPEESAEWARSPEGRQAFEELTGMGRAVDSTIDDLGRHAQDEDRLVAATELLRRTGAREVGVGREPAGWWAQVTFHDEPVLGDAAGQTLRVGGHSLPEEAVEELALATVNGGRCLRCGGTTSTVIDGPGICRFHRNGRQWIRSCE